MKQKRLEGLERYSSLLRQYHETLDLISPAVLEQLDQSLDHALQYAELIRKFDLKPHTVLDLGSGAGLPGIPVALALPHYQVILIEKRKRRAAFLALAKGQLKLSNVEVIHGDVTDLRGVKTANITAQAVASFDDVYCLTRHLQLGTCCLISRKSDAQVDAHFEQVHLQKSITKRLERPLQPHGRLVAIQLQGGLPCRQLES